LAEFWQARGKLIMKRNSILFLFLTLCWCLFSHSAAVWPWSVPAPSIPDRRAFLWVPPDCKQVRGLVIACHNMIEKSLFERPASLGQRSKITIVVTAKSKPRDFVLNLRGVALTDEKTWSARPKQ
jgi:hypothetical protein